MLAGVGCNTPGVPDTRTASSFPGPQISTDTSGASVMVSDGGTGLLKNVKRRSSKVRVPFPKNRA